MKLNYNETAMKTPDDPKARLNTVPEAHKDWAVRLSEGLLAWRWWLMGLISLLVIMVEIEEHVDALQSGYPPDFLRETFIFGIVIPLLNGMVLTLLARTRADKNIAERDLSQAYSLSQSLAQAKTWEELTSVIVEFPSKILSVAGASLYVVESAGDNYELEASWMQEEQRPLKPLASLNGELCSSCELNTRLTVRYLMPCSHQEIPQLNGTLRSYCMPLIHRDITMGLLILYFPGEMTVMNSQVRQLLGASPEIALALESARLQKTALSQERVTGAERRRIARNLHDTLGQNISYLRFKLDQLTAGDVLEEISDIRHDLERMREIADEAYGQVRATLEDLQIGSNLDLGKAILEYADLLGRRAGFQVHLAVNGRPHTLSDDVKRQLLYIGREALNNIEKHAHAHNVHVELLWTHEALSLSISDDGAGFDSSSAPPEGHFGIKIMRERANDIQATLQMSSRIGYGTQVNLWMPFNARAAETSKSVSVEKSANK
jgi:two-component system nitrate/nitrite sensor histidine kinase NarX